MTTADVDLEAAVAETTVRYRTSVIDAIQIATQEPFGLAFFMMFHLRPPHLSDDRKPWTFRGWLLPHVMDIFSCDGPRVPRLLGPIHCSGR